MTAAIGAAVVVSGGKLVHAHGQRVISALVEISTAPPAVFEIVYSFDVAMLFDGAVAIDRAWINTQSRDDLDAIADDTRDYLGENVSWSAGASELEGTFTFPDFEFLPDPGFDNGEPEGHIRVIYSGDIPVEGGRFTVALGDGAPFGVFTTRVDGRTKRRPAVLVGGESKLLVSIDASSTPGLPEVPEEVLPVEGGWAVPGDGSELDPVLFDDYGLGPEDGGWPQTAWVFLGDGLRHGLSDGWFHWLFGAAVFLFGDGWRKLTVPVLAMAAGSLLATLWQPGWDAGWVGSAGLGGVAAVAASAGLGRHLFWPGCVLAFATGLVHAGGGPTWFVGGDIGVAAPLGFWAGVELAHLFVLFLGFTFLGWAWGASYYKRWIVAPSAVVVVLVSIIAMATGTR